VNYFFDPSKNAWTNVTGQNVYQTLFDNYGFYVNGKLKYGWTGANIQTYNSGFGAASPTAASTNDPFTGAALATALPSRTVNTTIPDAGQIHQIIYESYGDGTYIQWDNYIISDEGKIASAADFAASVTGVGYQQGILKWNYEQVVTASEFQGRKIDL